MRQATIKPAADPQPQVPTGAGQERPRRPRQGRTGWNARVASKLRQVARGLSFRQVALRTNMNAETVRRYMRFGDPCVRFLARFCQEFGVSADGILGLAAPQPARHALSPGLTIRASARTPKATAIRSRSRNGSINGELRRARTTRPPTGEGTAAAAAIAVPSPAGDAGLQGKESRTP